MKKPSHSDLTKSRALIRDFSHDHTLLTDAIAGALELERKSVLRDLETLLLYSVLDAANQIAEYVEQPISKVKDEWPTELRRRVMTLALNVQALKEANPEIFQRFQIVNKSEKSPSE